MYSPGRTNKGMPGSVSPTAMGSTSAVGVTPVSEEARVSGLSAGAANGSPPSSGQTTRQRQSPTQSSKPSRSRRSLQGRGRFGDARADWRALGGFVNLQTAQS